MKGGCFVSLIGTKQSKMFAIKGYVWFTNNSKIISVILLPQTHQSAKSLDCFTKEVRNDRLK